MSIIPYCSVGEHLCSARNDRPFINFLPTKTGMLRKIAARMGLNVVTEIFTMSLIESGIRAGRGLTSLKKDLVVIRAYRDPRVIGKLIDADIELVRAKCGVSSDIVSSSYEADLIHSYWSIIQSSQNGVALHRALTKEWRGFALDKISIIDREEVIEPRIPDIIKRAGAFYRWRAIQFQEEIKSEFMIDVNLYNSPEMGKTMRDYAVLQLKLVGNPMINLRVGRVLSEVARTLFWWGEKEAVSIVKGFIKAPTSYEQAVYESFGIIQIEKSLFIQLRNGSTTIPYYRIETIACMMKDRFEEV